MFMLIVSCLSIPVAAVEAKLEIVNPRATYGHIGAVRAKSEGILPGDVAHVTFDIKNLKLDERGQAKYSVAIEVRDAKGQLFYEQKPFNAVAQNFFGGNVIPCSAHMDIPLDTPPTDLRWKVTVHDRLANASVTAEGTGKVLAPAFGLVRVSTSADPEGKVAIPPVGVAGSLLYVNFAAVGFGRDAKTKKPDIWVELRVLDDQGKPTFPKPLTGQVQEDISEKARLVPMHYGLTLNRVGQFTIELTARCRHCGVSSTVTFPVRILPMQ
jgi:hypothetical protein